MTGGLLPVVFFALFALILLGGYIGIRRHIGSPAALGLLVICGSVLAMFLVGLTSGDSPAHAIFVGLLVGGSFSVIILAISGYFLRSESRRAGVQPPPDSLPHENND